MQMRMLLGTTLGAVLLATTGCMVDRTYQPEPSRGFDDFIDNNDLDATVDDTGEDFDANDVDAAPPFVGVRDGLLSGDVGPAVGINQAPDRLAVYDDGYYLSIESVVQLENRAAMLMLSASNASDLFVAGTNRRFTFSAYEADGAQVYLLGCTGQDMDVFDEFDTPADEVDVVVEEAPDGEPGELQVQLAGRWNKYDNDGELINTQKATSRFTLRR